jgi:hypothetical protein
VPERGALELAPVDDDRRLSRGRGDLIRDGQHAVEAVLTSDVEIRGHLLGAQRRPGRLDLDETRPRLLAAPAYDRAVRDDRLARGVFKADLREGVDDS